MGKFLLYIFLFNSINALAQDTPATSNKNLVSATSNMEETEPFVNGYAKLFKQGKCFFINQSGKIINSRGFDEARNFSNKLAAVQIDGKWGFINENGKIVIPNSYGIVFDFTEEVTGAFANHQWVLINKSGKIIKTLDVEVFYGFKNGIAPIIQKGKKGTINLNGDIVSLDAEKYATSSKLNMYATAPNSIQALPCPPNIDFELNNYTNWVCYKGSVAAVGGVNVITVTPNVPPTSPTPGRHLIYPRIAVSALDPWGLFPTNPPDGSNYALKLGNTNVHSEAERVSYLINVPSGSTDASITYRYAVVFQDPGHLNYEQPRFSAKLFDVATNTYTPCASYEYISDSTLTGFYNSPLDPDVKCKAWSSVFVNLSAYAGKTMRLEFTTADCTKGAHWGYAYVDVGDCNITASINYSCNPSTATLIGPPGFEFYHWWDATYTTLLGSGQTTVLTPAPALNSIIHVEVIPFNGYGCQDTLDVTVTNNNPAVDAGPDKIICAGNTTTIGTTAVVGNTYSWSPATFLSNPNIAMPNANPPITTTYYLTAYNSVNGCSKIDSVVVTVNPAPTVNQPLDQIICSNTNTNAIMFSGTVSNTIYNWTNSNTAIGLAASGVGDINSFVATNTSNATITSTIIVTPSVGSCTGASKSFIIQVNPIPTVTQPIDQTLCANNNTSVISFNGTVSNTLYNWTNSNTAIGLASSGIGNINSFIATNTTNSQIVATILVTPNANGCPGAAKPFVIKVNPVPDVVQPLNQTLCNGFPTSAVSFSGSVIGTTFKWTNNNPSIGLAINGEGSIAAFTAINNTSAPITATISVSPATSDCSGATKTFNIVVNPTPKIVAGNSANVCLGKTAQLTVSGAALYNWSPTAYLNCTNCFNPISQPLDSITYLVKGTSTLGCDGYDSVLLSVIKPFKMQTPPGDSICPGGTIKLKASNAASYLWSPTAGLSNSAIAEPTAYPTTTTNYRVVGFDGYNCFTDTGYVLLKVGKNPSVNLGPDQTLSTGALFTIIAITQNGPIRSWMWDPITDLSCNNCPAPVATVKYNSFYSVLVTNIYGCTARDTIFINSFCKSSQVYIPNAFTPDGDGLNDILMVRGKGVTVKTFRIFNRWGELVFEKENFNANDPKFGWDGKIRGIAATPDVFVYTAEVFCDNGIVYTYKGNTTLLK